MIPTSPISINYRHPFLHKHRKHRKLCKYYKHRCIHYYSMKHNNYLQKTLRQLKWIYRVKQYKLLSKKRRMSFKFKQSMLYANILILFSYKKQKKIKETSSFMKPSKHNPYKTIL